MGGVYEEYSLKDPAGYLTIPKFVTDPDCSVKLDFQFYNITIDQSTGVKTSSY
jgi:hypothetical protein